MSDLRDIYQEIILEHSKKPRNFFSLDCPSHKSEGFNPLCGDKLKLYLNVKYGIIQDISFIGTGCAIFKSSASMMTEQLKGKTLEEAKKIFEQFHYMVSRETDAKFAKEDLGKLEVFSGICEYPVRVKCASLAWHTLKSALDEDNQAASTE